MAKTQYLQYTINLTDPEEVARLQGVTDPGSNQAVGAIIRAPYNPGPPAGGAAIEYNAPILAKDAPFAAPCITSPWFYTDANFPLDVATFTRKSGGWFGIPLLFGTTTRFYWRGVFAYTPPVTTSEVGGETVVAMAQRRWLDGFELPAAGEGGSGNNGNKVGRAFSRHVDGLGARFDNDNLQRSHAGNELRGGGFPRQMWERFYVRPRVFGSGQWYLHKINGSVSASAGIRLSIIPSGQLLIESLDSLSSTATLATVDAFTLHTWTRVDVLWRYYDGATAGSYTLFINGVQKFTYSSSSSSSGIGQSQLCQRSDIGGGTSNHGFHTDVDDWVGSDWPTGGSSASILPAIDWNNGSRIVLVRAKAYSSTNGTWSNTNAGSVYGLNQRPLTQNTINHTTSTASNRLSVVTDAARSIDLLQGQLGIAALVVAKYGTRGTTSGTLGYKFPATAEVLSSVTEGATGSWVNASYLPSGLTAPVTPVGALEFTHVKGADVGAATCFALMGVAEVLGKFYEEDKSPSSADVTAVDQEPLGRMPVHHNGPYPETPWAQPGPPPISGVVSATGTYIGNGTVTELTFNMPVHMVMIRNVSSAVAPIFWWSSMNMAHPAGQLQGFSESPVQVFKNPDFAAPPTEDAQSMQVIVRITGRVSNSNQSGQTYQYFVFGDAGMRFSLADGLQSMSYTGGSLPIGATGWTPEALLMQLEDSGSMSTVLAYHKGPGQTAAGLNRWATAAAFANGLTLGANALTLGSDLAGETGGLANAAYIAFRREDGNADANAPKVLQIASWTGDGSASRTINLSPASGRRPAFAICTPGNTTAMICRDPSHTGTTSLQLTNTVNASTGITGGGIDQVSVGSLLNANGVVYELLVFPGSATAGNGGWSTNGTEYPVEPNSPVGGPWGEEPQEPGEVVIPPTEPPTTTEGAFDFSADCVDSSTLIINKALSYIGVSKQVGDITTEASLEAVTARLHYSDDVSATLRDYPWSFATRYADLELVRGNADDIDLVQTYVSTRTYAVGDVVEYAGSAWYCIVEATGQTPAEGTYWTATFQEDANGDWTYAYRVPSRMMFARRIVNPDGSQRDYDPNPIKFRVGSDDNGGLIYTNEPNPELEYTIRLSCVAASGDTIFRKALTWRHASSLAPACARDDKKVQFCLAMYQNTLLEARAKDAAEQQQAPEGEADWITGRD